MYWRAVYFVLAVSDASFNSTTRRQLGAVSLLEASVRPVLEALLPPALHDPYLMRTVTSISHGADASEWTILEAPALGSPAESIVLVLNSFLLDNLTLALNRSSSFAQPPVIIYVSVPAPPPPSPPPLPPPLPPSAPPPQSSPIVIIIICCTVGSLFVLGCGAYISYRCYKAKRCTCTTSRGKTAGRVLSKATAVANSVLGGATAVKENLLRRLGYRKDRDEWSTPQLTLRDALCVEVKWGTSRFARSFYHVYVERTDGDITVVQRVRSSLQDSHCVVDAGDCSAKAGQILRFCVERSAKDSSTSPPKAQVQVPASSWSEPLTLPLAEWLAASEPLKLQAMSMSTAVATWPLPSLVGLEPVGYEIELVQTASMQAGVAPLNTTSEPRVVQVQSLDRRQELSQLDGGSYGARVRVISAYANAAFSSFDVGRRMAIQSGQVLVDDELRAVNWAEAGHDDIPNDIDDAAIEAVDPAIGGLVQLSGGLSILNLRRPGGGELRHISAWSPPSASLDMPFISKVPRVYCHACPPEENASSKDACTAMLVSWDVPHTVVGSELEQVELQLRDEAGRRCGDQRFSDMDGTTGFAEMQWRFDSLTPSCTYQVRVRYLARARESGFLLTEEDQWSDAYSMRLPYVSQIERLTLTALAPGSVEARWQQPWASECLDEMSWCQQHGVQRLDRYLLHIRPPPNGVAQHVGWLHHLVGHASADMPTADIEISAEQLPREGFVTHVIDGLPLGTEISVSVGAIALVEQSKYSDATTTFELHSRLTNASVTSLTAEESEWVLTVEFGSEGRRLPSVSQEPVDIRAIGLRAELLLPAQVSSSSLTRIELTLKGGQTDPRLTIEGADLRALLDASGSNSVVRHFNASFLTPGDSYAVHGKTFMDGALTGQTEGNEFFRKMKSNLITIPSVTLHPPKLSKVGDDGSICAVWSVDRSVGMNEDAANKDGHRPGIACIKFFRVQVYRLAAATGRTERNEGRLVHQEDVDFLEAATKDDEHSEYVYPRGELGATYIVQVCAVAELATAKTPGGDADSHLIAFEPARSDPFTLPRATLLGFERPTLKPSGVDRLVATWVPPPSLHGCRVVESRPPSRFDSLASMVGLGSPQQLPALGSPQQLPDQHQRDPMSPRRRLGLHSKQSVHKLVGWAEDLEHGRSDLASAVANGSCVIECYEVQLLEVSLQGKASYEPKHLINEPKLISANDCSATFSTAADGVRCGDTYCVRVTAKANATPIGPGERAIIPLEQSVQSDTATLPDAGQLPKPILSRDGVDAVHAEWLAPSATVACRVVQYRLQLFAVANEVRKEVRRVSAAAEALQERFQERFHSLVPGEAYVLRLMALMVATSADGTDLDVPIPPLEVESLPLQLPPPPDLQLSLVANSADSLRVMWTLASSSMFQVEEVVVELQSASHDMKGPSMTHRMKKDETAFLVDAHTWAPLRAPSARFRASGRVSARIVGSASLGKDAQGDGDEMEHFDLLPTEWVALPHIPALSAPHLLLHSLTRVSVSWQPPERMVACRLVEHAFEVAEVSEKDRFDDTAVAEGAFEGLAGQTYLVRVSARASALATDGSQLGFTLTKISAVSQITVPALAFPPQAGTSSARPELQPTSETSFLVMWKPPVVCGCAVTQYELLVYQQLDQIDDASSTQLSLTQPHPSASVDAITIAPLQFLYSCIAKTDAVTSRGTNALEHELVLRPSSRFPIARYAVAVRAVATVPGEAMLQLDATTHPSDPRALPYVGPPDSLDVHVIPEQQRFSICAACGQRDSIHEVESHPSLRLTYAEPQLIECDPQQTKVDVEICDVNGRVLLEHRAILTYAAESTHFHSLVSGSYTLRAWASSKVMGSDFWVTSARHEQRIVSPPGLQVQMVRHLHANAASLTSAEVSWTNAASISVNGSVWQHLLIAIKEDEVEQHVCPACEQPMLGHDLQRHVVSARKERYRFEGLESDQAYVVYVQSSVAKNLSSHESNSNSAGGVSGWAGPARVTLPWVGPVPTPRLSRGPGIQTLNAECELPKSRLCEVYRMELRLLSQTREIRLETCDTVPTSRRMQHSFELTLAEAPEALPLSSTDSRNTVTAMVIDSGPVPDVSNAVSPDGKRKQDDRDDGMPRANSVSALRRFWKMLGTLSRQKRQGSPTSLVTLVRADESQTDGPGPFRLMIRAWVRLHQADSWRPPVHCVAEKPGWSEPSMPVVLPFLGGDRSHFVLQLAAVGSHALRASWRTPVSDPAERAAVLWLACSPPACKVTLQSKGDHGVTYREIVTGDTTSIVISDGLESGVQYTAHLHVHATAVDAQGEIMDLEPLLRWKSPASNAVTLPHCASVAPPTLECVEGSFSSLVVRWVLPRHVGCELKHFEIELSDEAGRALLPFHVVESREEAHRIGSFYVRSHDEVLPGLLARHRNDSVRIVEVERTRRLHMAVPEPAKTASDAKGLDAVTERISARLLQWSKRAKMKLELRDEPVHDLYLAGTLAKVQGLELECQFPTIVDVPHEAYRFDGLPNSQQARYYRARVRAVAMVSGSDALDADTTFTVFSDGVDGWSERGDPVVLPPPPEMIPRPAPRKRLVTFDLRAAAHVVARNLGGAVRLHQRVRSRLMHDPSTLFNYASPRLLGASKEELCEDNEKDKGTADTVPEIVALASAPSTEEDQASAVKLVPAAMPPSRLEHANHAPGLLAPRRGGAAATPTRPAEQLSADSAGFQHLFGPKRWRSVCGAASPSAGTTSTVTSSRLEAVQSGPVTPSPSKFGDAKGRAQTIGEERVSVHPAERRPLPPVHQRKPWLLPDWHPQSIEDSLKAIAPLNDAPVRLVDARYLIQEQEKGLQRGGRAVLKRRQLLPESAFVRLEDLKQMDAGGIDGKDCLRIVCISQCATTTSRTDSSHDPCPTTLA